MPYRSVPLVNNEIYHIFNRGVAKLPIFEEYTDQLHLLRTLYYYQFNGPKPKLSHLNRFSTFNLEGREKIVEILCYCFMPNHFHLMIKQLTEGGISEFMRKVSDSYTKFLNTKYKRVGPLFQGPFKSVLVENDQQLTHLSRYIHLNPVVANLEKNPESYQFSSFKDYLNEDLEGWINKKVILSLFSSPLEYEKFTLDQVDYARSLKTIKNSLLDDC
jgi:putative transposase